MANKVFLSCSEIQCTFRCLVKPDQFLQIFLHSSHVRWLMSRNVSHSWWMVCQRSYADDWFSLHLTDSLTLKVDKLWHVWIDITIYSRCTLCLRLGICIILESIGSSIPELSSPPISITGYHPQVEIISLHIASESLT